MRDPKLAHILVVRKMHIIFCIFMHNYAFYFEFSVIFLMFLMDQLVRPILPKSMKPRILEKLGDVFTRVLHGDLIITKKSSRPKSMGGQQFWVSPAQSRRNNFFKIFRVDDNKVIVLY